jgi:hypothetical protein
MNGLCGQVERFPAIPAAHFPPECAVGEAVPLPAGTATYQNPLRIQCWSHISKVPGLLLPASDA